MSGRDTVRVRRHVVRARVTTDAGAGRAVAASLGDTLVEALGDHIARVLAAGDGSVWLIRRLDVRAAVATSWSATQIASSVAAGTARSLAAVLDRGANGESVLWFPSRAAYVSRYLLDTADGRAGGRWEYAGFGGSEGRSASAAIEARFDTDPREAIDALAALSAAERARVLASLTPGAAGSVLRAVEAIEDRSGHDPAPAVVAALQRRLDRADLPDDERVAALGLVLDVASAKGGAPPAGTGDRARDAIALAAVLRGARDAARLADALGRGDWGAVDPVVRSRVAGLTGWPVAIRRAAVASIVAVTSGTTGSRPLAADRLSTPLGGMFLLLPLLRELPWRAMTATWAGTQHVDADRLLQYLAVIAALGRDRNAVAVRDPVLRHALGVPARLDAPAIAEWASAITSTAAQAATDALVSGLLDRGKVSGEVTLAPLGDGVVAVDGARGIWLGTAASAPASIAGLVDAIDRAAGDAVATATTDPWIEVCLDPRRRRPADVDERLLARLAEQARCATLGPPVDVPPAVRDVVTLAAQALGRELAWRLPGFARSTLLYLGDQFLSFEASVAVEPDRFVVHVGDPPLHLVLSLAGMNRRTFHLDATGARPWVLTREQ